MRLGRLTVLALMLVVGGCAAAAPGYTPPDANLDKYKAAAPRGGGFDQAGRYSLSEQEQKLNCKQLTGSITIKIVQMRDARNRIQPSAIASAAQTTVRPIVGGSAYGASIDEDLRTDRARLEALNRQLAAKSCPTFDLDGDLAPGNKNPPRPVKAPGRKP
ncbi:MAG: hypothetical protein SFW09_07265 [Hyphomicrobiaceae bacterium]|nr:hypothetical protein [Hyphomicrobiaceae bacterium]